MLEGGHAEARAARDVFERVLVGLGGEPAAEADVLSPATRLLRGVAVLWVVRDTGSLSLAHLEGLGEAASVARDVASRLADVDEETARSLRACEAQLRAAFDRVAAEQSRRRQDLEAGRVDDAVPEPTPFQASVGEPRLHAIARRPLLPAVARVEEESAGEPPPVTPDRPAASSGAASAPTTIAEARGLRAALREQARRALDEAPRPERAEAGTLEHVDLEPALEDVELLRRLGRDALEDVALARTLRTPNELESWTDIAPFEQRLLDQIDAFVAYGPSALSQVHGFLFEAPDDADRAFAAALALGCVAGADAIGAAILDVRQAAPDAWPGAVEGFALAPHPSIDPWMEDLARSSDPRVSQLGLEVLARRGSTPPGLALELVTSASVEVRVLALRVLGRCGSRRDAIAALELAAVEGEPVAVQLAAVEAMLDRRHPEALGALRRLSAVDAARPTALAWRALAGTPADTGDLVAAFLGNPTADLALALGRHGDPASIEPLVAALDGLDGEIRDALADGLQLMTGAPLVVVVREPWPIELPDTVDPESIRIPERDMRRVVSDPGAWRQWLRGAGRDALRALGAGTSPRRMRAGTAYHPRQSVDALEALRATPSQRAIALREVRWATGVDVHVGLDDWVVRQRKQLVALRAAVEAAAVAPGSWPTRDRVESAPAPAPASSPPPPPALPPRAAARRGDVDAEPAAPPWAPPSTPPPPRSPSAPPQPAAPPAPSPWAPPPAPSPSAAASSAPVRRPPPTTMVLGAVPISAATPFERPPAPRAGDELRGTRALGADAHFGPALPFGGDAPAAPLSPTDAMRKISIAVYAAVCAEIGARPDHADVVFARYGLRDPALRAVVDAAYKRAMADDPALRARFEGLVARARRALG